MSSWAAVSDLLSPGVVGVIVALGLAAVLRALLPATSKHLVRQPVAFVALHLVLRTVLMVLRDGSIGARIVSLVALVFLLASIGRSSLLLALEVVIGPRLARPLPRIFRDILQAGVYLVLLLVALRSVGVEPGSILTTSALLTAAIALSLQETLGNLVAGLAIQAERPFDVDDWIQFDADPKHIGRVLEINWRATKVMTLDEVEVVVPNATLAKAPIVNFTKPASHSRRSLYVQAPADVPPHLAQRTILEAIAGVSGVMADPPASVVTNQFVEGNVEYWVRFFTDQFHRRDVVDGAARDRIWYAFARAGIPLAAPNRAVRLREVSEGTQAHKADLRTRQLVEMLDAVDFLSPLSEEQRHELAAASKIHLYADGERIVRQGDRTAEMFIVQSGEVVVERERGDGHAVELARLGRGQFFGEMALMTGEGRSATVRASRASTLIGVDHRALRAVLEGAPDLAEHISRVIAERHAAEPAASEEEEPVSVEERSSQLLGRIRKFFAL